MTKTKVIVLFLIIVSYSCVGQFKTQVREQQSSITAITRQNTSGLIFGLFDPSKLFMRQTYTLSYTAGNGHGYSLGVYTNSLVYKISDPLALQFDISLVHSPYSSPAIEPMTRSLIGLHLTRAQLTYQPTKSFSLYLQYHQSPIYMGNLFTPFDDFSLFPSVQQKEEER
ncbi:MAG: hypothetical protein N3A63_01005 [Bacteroidetes bacterium]|nr:hypothetical protein [Bacteroidota bacterium]